jgi:hypothetical protein
MTTDDLEDRLRRLGQAPIAPEIESTHRHAIAQASASAPRARFGWKAVATATLAGFFAGSTALAAAGSLPDPAQDVAHGALGAVGINVPRSTEGCPDGTSYRNHGEYVAAVEAAGGDVEEAARSDCGKPVKAAKGKGNGKGGPGRAAPGAAPDRDGDPCTGPPPWAGTHLDAEAKERARADREATCGPDDDAEVDQGDEGEDPAARSGAATTTVPEATTTPETTTTTTVAETTSTVADTTTTTAAATTSQP